MGYLKTFSIPLQGLIEGQVRRISFQVNDKFLSYFPEALYEIADVKADVSVVKTDDFIILEFNLKGTVNVQCDMCLDFFDKEIFITRHLYLTTNPGTGDESRDVVLIGIDENHVNVAHYLYEFLHLAVPIKNMHPQDEQGNSTCNPEMLRIIREHKESRKKKEDEIDPRWAKLQELKNRNN